MKKPTLFGLIGLGLGAVTVGRTAIRYACAKRAIRTGEADLWIKDVLGKEVAYEIKHDIPIPAYIEDNRSKVYFRLNDTDLMQIALTKGSFKDTLQCIAAHEKGHAVDKDLEAIQKIVHKAIQEKDADTYKRMVLHREQRAWDLGKAYAPKVQMFDQYNKLNMAMYKICLNNEVKTFK